MRAGGGGAEPRELGGDVVARGEQRGAGEGERAGGDGGVAEEVAAAGHGDLM
jgi:hypothetical protein